MVKKYKVRPAGRHLQTIGSDLIQDNIAALIELIKNAFDADSPDVILTLKMNEKRDEITIIVEDHGHGMSHEDISTKWLVPSTINKLVDRQSPSGRIMQGRKGIGRYAASILGQNLDLTTIDNQGYKSTVTIDWNVFSKAEYLDEIDIQVTTIKSELPSGTTLLIKKKILTQEDYWTSKQIDKLRFELKKLIPPKIKGIKNIDFSINLVFDNFIDNQTEVIYENVDPYPILDLYDYGISGKIDEKGFYELSYVNNKEKEFGREIIKGKFADNQCGVVIVDLRIYDRERESLEQMVTRGLTDSFTGKYVSYTQARQLLNEVNGIGVYRNGFRIRPLGDSDNDWLNLNNKRIQNPSKCISSNQTVGYVHIGSEEDSGLIETSARDGLKKNEAYSCLVNILESVINELEQRRFIYRRKLKQISPTKQVSSEILNLYDYTDMRKSIEKKLSIEGIEPNIVHEIDKIIEKDIQVKNTKIEEVLNIVAVYQGQATLGKIIDIILHEGRRPLNYFKNQIPNLKHNTNKFIKNPDDENKDKLFKLTDGLQENADVFVKLFSRLDPLATKKRETRRIFKLYDAIINIKDVFEIELKRNKIKIHLETNKDIDFFGWQQDIYTIFTNLIDNSIFWLIKDISDQREISIRLESKSQNSWHIDFIDNGPGIGSALIESGVIFDPQFTTKPNGIGLGLAIAGEAATRNNLRLTALESDKGAHFRLETI